MTAGRHDADRKRRFDAFISYSHAADTELARALRDALQHFATPWSPWIWANPIRSLRVFRDQSALSPDPALWPAIERALAASDWFVLLASVDAANSPWIDKEVSFWCAHKPSERMLLVQTDGELAWDHDAGDFDWKVCTTLPRRLAGVFTLEPLWLDLRWTESQPVLDPGNPRFNDAVASIASPIRGIPKDDLIGEDIRPLDGRLDVLRSAVQAAGFQVEAELGRDSDRVADRRERLSDQVLAGIGPIHLRRVEKRDTFLMGRADDPHGPCG